MADEARAAALLAERLGLSFHRLELLQEALTHPSYANECDGEDVLHNQRLEFLGDAVLDLVVGRWLYEQMPGAAEGELTSLRARIVRTEGLADLASELDLGTYMRFGRGEEASGGREKPANLCAGYEALVGALYLDQGLAAVKAWFIPILAHRAAEAVRQRPPKDAKSQLQEYTQANLHVTPHYEVVEAHGPDHAREFTVRVMVAGECWGTGTGSSKQLAQQSAAHEALDRRGDQAGG